VRNKLSIGLIAPTLVVLACTGAWAQQRIAIVDMQGAIMKTKDGQQATAELKAKFGSKEEDINKRNQQLVAKRAEYQKTGATLSDAARAIVERDIAAFQKALERDTDDARNDVQAEENRLLGGIMQKMQSVMQRYASDKQLAMIVDTSSQPNNLLYADKSINITLDVIALYDKASAAPLQSATPAPAPKTTAPATAPAPKKPAATTPPGLKN
jgi:outer membrane protein